MRWSYRGGSLSSITPQLSLCYVAVGISCRIADWTLCLSFADSYLDWVISFIAWLWECYFLEWACVYIIQLILTHSLCNAQIVDWVFLVQLWEDEVFQDFNPYMTCLCDIEPSISNFFQWTSVIIKP